MLHCTFSGPGACLRPWPWLPLTQSTPRQIRNAGAFGRLATSGFLPVIAVLVERIQPEPRPTDAQVQRLAELVARRRMFVSERERTILISVPHGQPIPR